MVSSTIFKSIRAALEGLKSAASEQTFRVFILFAILIIILMIIFRVSLAEKLILILTITFVMALELINSQIERVLDIFHPAEHPKIKIIKDISAGAVLISCIGALAIGILIFLPHLKKLFLV